MTLRQLQLLHSGAVEQRWSEVAWLCHVLVNLQRATDRDPVHAPNEFNPLRLAEAKAAGAAGPAAPQRRGGMPLDREMIRAYHAVLKRREQRRREARAKGSPRVLMRRHIS